MYVMTSSFDISCLHFKMFACSHASEADSQLGDGTVCGWLDAVHPAVGWWQRVVPACSRSTETNPVAVKLDEHSICAWMNVDTLDVAVL